MRTIKIICFCLLSLFFTNCSKDEQNVLLGTYVGTYTSPITTKANYQVVITQNGSQSEKSIIVTSGGSSFICSYSSNTFNGSSSTIDINGSLNTTTGSLGISYSNGASFNGKKQ